MTLGYEPWWWPPRGQDPAAWLIAMQEAHATSPLDDIAPPDCLPPRPADHGWRPITKPVAGEAFGAYSRGMYALAWPMVAGWGVLVKRWSGGRWRTVSALGVSDRRDARDHVAECLRRC